MVEFGWKLLLVTFAFITAGPFLSLVFRDAIHQFAFYGMNKSRRKEILKSRTKFQFIFMTYAARYNNRRKTIFCLVCYYYFILSLLLSLCFMWGSLFVDLQSLLPTPLIVTIFGGFVYTPLVVTIFAKTAQNG